MPVVIVVSCAHSKLSPIDHSAGLAPIVIFYTTVRDH